MSKDKKKDKKPFWETTAGQWLTKVKDKLPELAGDVVDVVASGNPIGAIASKILPKLKTSQNPVSIELMQEYEIRKMEIEKDIYALELSNTNKARDMYMSTDHDTADRIAKSVINWNLLIVLGLVAAQVLVIIFVEGTIAAVITGVVGTITGALLQERNTVINFFFGSSKSSRDKDKKLNPN